LQRPHLLLLSQFSELLCRSEDFLLSQGVVPKVEPVRARDVSKAVAPVFLRVQEMVESYMAACATGRLPDVGHKDARRFAKDHITLR
jgi:hypothetical protein